MRRVVESLARIYAIALNTFREAVRNKVLYGVVVIVVLVNVMAIVLGELSLNEEVRVARDLGLGGLSFFGAVTAIVLGVMLLYGEIRRKTVYAIVSKPIERFEFVLGKYVGMAITLTCLVIIFGLFVVIVVSIRGGAIDAAIVKALLLAYMEVLIVAAVAIFFSSFSTPFLSGIFTFCVFVMGRSTNEMRAAVATSKNEGIRTICDLALKIVPDFHVFSISGGVVRGEHVSVHGTFVDWGYMGTSVAYAALYIATMLVLSVVIFSRRNFV